MKINLGLWSFFLKREILAFEGFFFIVLKKGPFKTFFSFEKVLTPEEKRFLLFVERGDCASAARTIKSYKSKPYLFDINCTDPLGRSSLSIAIINENPEMMELLLEEGIQVKDALLLAISEEYVEGVELLLQVR